MIRTAVKCTIALSLLLCVCARAATLEAIEYYNATLDHYFVTALASEIASLDAGSFAGWQRTGQHFTVFDPGTPVGGASPVCRFYGVPAAGLDSHFYSASPGECAAVRQRFPGVWVEETDNAFGVFLPDTATGQCPAASVPVYRAWNGRADSNHRFTTDPATLQAMVAKGYIAEGYGPAPLPVAMCAPDEGATGSKAVPACVVSASSPSARVGATVTLTAACTNNPIAFTWTNCMSAGAQCSATSTAVGSATYSVVARNNAGASAPASVSVLWQAVASAPKCTIARTSQTDPPTVKGFVALEANCSATIGNYSWNGCTSTTRTCIAHESSPGVHTYSVIGRSAGGSSEPATLSLNWAASPPPAPGFCASFPSYLYSDIGSQTVRVESVLMPAPAFAWNGVWTVRFVVPATMSAASVGSMSSVEFSGPTIVREVTISRTPCDFRATDASGTSGPLARQSGNSNTIQFAASASHPGYPVLNPGSTYYYNVRNFQPGTNTISCPSSPGRCDALVESLLPTR